MNFNLVVSAVALRRLFGLPFAFFGILQDGEWAGGKQGKGLSTADHDMNICGPCLTSGPAAQQCHVMRLCLWNLEPWPDVPSW